MTVNISYFAGAGWQFFDSSGTVLSGGKLYSYLAGTTTPATTYTDNSGNNSHTNPIFLDSAGRVNEVWLTVGTNYKFVLTDSNDVPIATYDNICSVPNPATLSNYATLTDLANTVADFANTSNVAKGDALVGFKASQPSGLFADAVGKTVHQKFQEMVSVFDFMTAAEVADVVAGNMTLDVIGPIQNCIDAVTARGGGAIFMPAGVYKITAAIEVASRTISIYGEGANATVIQALSCNGINIISPSSDRDTQFFQDFSLIGMTGSTANWAAIESILPPGGTSGVDSRDGLHFLRIKLFDWNQGFIIADTWEWSIQLCKFQKVRNPVRLNNYAMVGRIINNYMVYESGDSHGGTAEPYAIDMQGPVTEGIVVEGNQLYGFNRALNAANAIFINFVYNDVFATEIGIRVSTINNLFYCAGNYIEVNGNDAICIKIDPLNSEINSQNVIHANNFICSGGTGVIGIKTGAPATQYAWRNDIQFNLFTAFNSYDILLEEGSGKTNIANNRCGSTGASASIRISAVYGPPITVSQNWCYKSIQIAEAADLTGGKVLLYQNTENNSYQAWRQTSAPAAGTWKLGDIVWNSDPASAEYVGWVCTVAGTPGTWKGFGTIA